jgi:hypothetical protein
MLLDFADAMAQRRLGKIEMEGRGTKTATLGNGDEGLKAEHVDSHPGCTPVRAFFD